MKDKYQAFYAQRLIDFTGDGRNAVALNIPGCRFAADSDCAAFGAANEVDSSDLFLFAEEEGSERTPSNFVDTSSGRFQALSTGVALVKLVCGERVVADFRSGPWDQYEVVSLTSDHIKHR